jgi:hypothetical protein|tara:strand:+ start:84 stop:932 length:849 start_codon:yes stop_codon:yes gene_type:complete
MRLDKSETFKYFKKSDRLSLKWNSYFLVYDKIFRKYKNKKIKFVEIGVANGGSLFIWRKLFGKKAKIIGIDANPYSKKLSRYGFKIYTGDQSDPDFWKKFFKKEGKVDVILDDGGHKNLQQISTVHYTLPYVKDGGMIVVEDMATSYLKKEFYNPSRFSFINFCNKIIEFINYRSGLIKKKMNFYSKKIYSIEFFDSIVVLNIDTSKCFKSRSISNNVNDPSLNEMRNSFHFKKTREVIKNKFPFLKNSKFYNKVERKIFYRNKLLNFKENLIIKKILRNIN